MLIQSPRHKADDLEIWQELEQADIVAGIQSQKVEQSKTAVLEFSNSGPCYCGISWGKDSTALFHIANIVGFSGPFVWMRYGKATNPECESVRNASLMRWPDCDYREIDVGEAEDQRDDFSRAVQITGTRRYMSGVRADESGMRKIVMRRWGTATEITCRPLGWWTTQDVFSFLAIESLPVHPNYAMLGGGRWQRKYLRTASIGGERGNQFGRREWEQEYYGDVLRRMEAGK